MHLKKLQQDIDVLVKRINDSHGYPNPEVISHMKVVEEIGELTEAMLSTFIKSRKGEKCSKEQAREKVGSEIADSIIALISLASDYGVDIDEIIEKKLKIHNTRYSTQR